MKLPTIIIRAGIFMLLLSGLSLVQEVDRAARLSDIYMYLGTYHNRVFGQITITEYEHKLSCRFNRIPLELTRQGEGFIISGDFF